MATLTREQFNKWNAQAKNNFQFDLQWFCVWNEKTLTKKIRLDGGKILELKLEYIKEFETKTNEHGCRWNVETGRYIPILDIRIWKPSESGSGCYIQTHEKSYIIGDAEKSKKYNVLCKFSGELDENQYIDKFKKYFAITE